MSSSYAKRRKDRQPWRCSRGTGRCADLAAQQSLEQARKSAQSAKLEAELSRQTQNFLTSIIEGSDPLDDLFVHNSLPDKDPPTLATLLDRAQQRVGDELSDQPVLQARLMDTIGNACRAAGRFDQASKLLQDAQLLRSQLDIDRDSLRSDRTQNDFYRARLQHDLGRYQTAQGTYDQLIAEHRARGESAELDLAKALFFRGKLMLELRDNESAIDSFTECLKIRRRHLAPESVSIKLTEIAIATANGTISPELIGMAFGDQWATELAMQYLNMLLHREFKQFDVACRKYQSIVQQLVSRVGSNASVVLLAKGDYAGLLYDAGNYRECERVTRDVLSRLSEQANSHPQVRLAKLRFADELLEAGNATEATAIYEELVSGRSDISAYQERELLGLIWCDLALANSERMLAAAHELLQRCDVTAHQRAWYCHTAARAFEKVGDRVKSRSSDEEAYRFAKSVSQTIDDAEWLARIAAIHAQHGDLESAERLLDQAVRIESSLRFPEHPRVAMYLFKRAQLLGELGRDREAIQIQREVLQIWQQCLPQHDRRIEAAAHAVGQGTR